MDELKQRRILGASGWAPLVCIVITKSVRRLVGPPAGLILGSGPSFFFSSGCLLVLLSMRRRLNRSSLFAVTAAAAAVSLALEMVQPLLRVTLLQGSKITYDSQDLAASVAGILAAFLLGWLLPER